MHKNHQILSLCCSLLMLFYAIQYLYAVSHAYIKIPTLVSCFSTKGIIFTVNQYNFTTIAEVIIMMTIIFITVVIAYVTGPAKIDHVSADYTEFYFC